MEITKESREKTTQQTPIIKATKDLNRTKPMPIFEATIKLTGQNQRT